MSRWDQANNTARAIAALLTLVSTGAPAGAQCAAFSSWTLRQPASVPPARSQHGMAFDSAAAGGGRAVIFGGLSGPTLYNDLWEWNATGGAGGVGVWTQRTPAGSAPAARSGHVLVYDSARASVLLFGGFGGGLLGDTWEWNGAAGTWTQRLPASAPSPRRNAAAAYDSGRQRVVLFGGNNGSLLGDTWEWDGAAGTWTLRSPASSPAPRELAAATYDSSRARTIVFGGLVGDERLWEWNGAAGSWTPRSATPSAPDRQGATLVFDSARSRAVLFGGQNTGTLNDTWEWNGAAGTWWHRDSAASPSSRTRHAMVFDPARAVCVLFGGLVGGPIADTWEIGAPAGPAISQQPSSQSAGQGGVATLSVSATGSGSVSYQWRKAGSGLASGGGYSGVQSPTLTINPVAPSHAGVYDVVVTDSCGSTVSATATLTVTTGCAADVDHNTLVEPADIALFVNTWFNSLVQGTLAGDFDTNGLVQPADIALFINAWFGALTSGC